MIKKIFVEKMRTLLVTAGLTESRVKRVIKRLKGYDIFVGDSDVAACLSPEHLITYMRDKSYDKIIVPGMIVWDLDKIEEETKTKVFKGPKDIADLEFVLKNIDKIKLSKDTPACELLKEKMKTKALEEIKEVDTKEYKDRMLEKPCNILVGDIPVGPDFPIRVLAEIVDATRLKTDAIKKRAEYFIESGVDILDIGINEQDPDGVENAIEVLREYNIPLSIDTMEKENIKKALDCDIDMIMSFDYSLLNQFRDIETPVVVIPKKETIPKDYNKKIKILEENIKLARDRGFKNIIADLILEPVNLGFADSVTAYKIFSNTYNMPLLFGIGNVTELMDADSVGINAVLSGIAMECNASIVFTPEHSDKAQGSVGELATASKMMYLAKKRGSMPKDLGIDLLRFKEKRIRREKFNEELYKNTPVFQADIIERHDYDPKGYFKIFVDDEIKAVHYKDKEPKLVIRGNRAKEISDALFSLSLISDMSHALYLGRELLKAETALKTGKSYVQDKEIF